MVLQVLFKSKLQHTYNEDKQVDVVKLVANITCYSNSHIPAISRDGYI